MNITLGEALNLRADLQISIEQIKARILENVKVQEGDEASLSPNELKKELFSKIDDLTSLIRRINATNNTTKFSGDLFLTDALVLRDGLMKKRSALNSMIESASSKENRYSMSEIRFISLVDIKKLQDELNQISKEWRSLDTKIQQLNWSTYLIK